MQDFSHPGLCLLFQLYLLPPFPDFQTYQIIFPSLHTQIFHAFNFAFAIYPKCSSCPSTRLSFTLFSKSSSGVPPRPEKLPCLPLLFIPPSSVPSVFFYKTIILIVGLYWPSTTCTRPWARHLTWTYLSLTTILETDYYHVNFTEEEVCRQRERESNFPKVTWPENVNVLHRLSQPGLATE